MPQNEFIAKSHVLVDQPKIFVTLQPLISIVKFWFHFTELWVKKALIFTPKLLKAIWRTARKPLGQIELETIRSMNIHSVEKTNMKLNQSKYFTAS